MHLHCLDGRSEDKIISYDQFDLLLGQQRICCFRKLAISCNLRNMASFGVRGMSQNFGIKICCCRVCTCINFGFITSKAGLLKLIQLGLATLCDGLLLKYGIPAADTIGQALTGFLTTTSYCFTTTAILLACYCFSDKSYSLIRQSLFVSFKEFIWIQHFHWKKYNIEESI